MISEIKLLSWMCTLYKEIEEKGERKQLEESHMVKGDSGLGFGLV